MNEKTSFPAKVWKTLSEVNVNDKTEKKQNLTYLSWAWAWQVLMEYFPESSYRIHEEKYFSDGTCEVGVTVTVKEGENEISRYMWLPVINHKNAAITNPNAFEVNKNKMRCLVKCIGMFGLGLYIYAGEDLPETEYQQPEKPKPKTLNVEEVIKALKNAADLAQLNTYYSAAAARATDEQMTAITETYEQRKVDFELAQQE